MNWRILVVTFITTLSYGDIGGVVYKDLPLNGTTVNSYGVKDTNELGLKGVKVTIQTKSGKEFTTTTNDNGSWHFVSNEENFRVEFSNWSKYLTESSKSTDGKNSAVEFVQNGEDNITFGLYDVNSYFTTANPSFTTTIIGNGDVNNSTVPALVTNHYADKGLNGAFQNLLGTQGEGPSYVVDAKASEIGTVWGVGYQAYKKRMFLASSLWRHVANIENKLGLVFVADYTKNSEKIIGKMNLEGINGIHLGDVNRSGNMVHDLSTGPLEPNVDVDAYVKVGKYAYGDLDFDEKSQTLWVVNLFQQAIIKMDASSDNLEEIASSAQQYKLADLSGVPVCSGGALRPWALAINAGKGYVGMICDASVSQKREDLKAYLSSFDLEHPENGLKTELAINMDYDRKTNADGEQSNQYFFPWSDEVHQTISYVKDYFWDDYNQPILTDIEFDEHGNAYLAFTDRYALQIGYQNYPASKYPPDIVSENIEAFGEIFKACNSNGKLELEGTGSCTKGTARGDNGDVDFFDDNGGDNNANSNGGALALIPGTQELLSTVNSPHPTDEHGKEYWDLTGVETFSTVDGSINNWYAHLLASERPFRGKGVGLGDIELLNESAPVEIGDYVWRDGDGNGKQDAYEAGIAGVTIELLKDNNIIASAVTDKDGAYLFSSATSDVESSSHIYNLTELVANSSYQLRISNATGSEQQESLKDLYLTSANISDGENALLHDSNAEANETSAVVTVVPKVGENLHSIDIGFKPLVPDKRVVVDPIENNNSDENCDCPAYTESDSISLFQNKMIISLFLLFNLLGLFYVHKELLGKVEEE